MRALFRVDAGASVGLGHLQRCLSLALALREQGTASRFLVRVDAAALSRISAAGFEADASPDGQPGEAIDAAPILEVAARHRCAAVIVDSYDATTPLFAELRRAGLFVVAIDDHAVIELPCRVVINGGAHAESLPYRAGEDARLLLGPRYALLRPEFWKIEPRPVAPQVKTVLVTLGGADPQRLMPRLLEELARIDALQWIAIVGPSFSHGQAVREAARRAKRVRVVEQPTAVSGLMQEANLAVSAAGQTLYELARVGCPTVAIRAADNQTAQLEAFKRLGIVDAAGDAADRNICATVAQRVRGLIASPDRRAAMSAAGQGLIDGQGALRVASVMREIGAAHAVAPAR